MLLTDVVTASAAVAATRSRTAKAAAIAGLLRAAAPEDVEPVTAWLAGVAISMFWLWTTVFLVIVGAAVNAETEKQTERDSTVGPEQPLGERGAVVADSAPPYPGEG